MKMLTETFNPKERTIDLVFTTEDAARMIRFDYEEGRYERFNEILSMKKEHIINKRMENGAPLLDSHQRYTLKDQLGVVLKTWVDGDRYMGRVKFSSREDVQPIMKDVEEGIIRNASIGYAVHRYKDETQKGDKIRTLRAIEWEPMEISLVTIPADSRAGVGKKEQDLSFKSEIIIEEEEMPEKKKNEQTPAPKKVEGQNLGEEAGIEKERERCSKITRAVRRAGLPEKYAEKLISEGTKLDVALEAIVDARAEADANEAPEISYQGSVRVGADLDQINTRREAAVNGLLHRHKPGAHQLTDEGRHFRSLSLLELGRKCLEWEGVRTDTMSRKELAERSLHSISDLGNILSSAMNKELRRGYEAAPQTFTVFGVEKTAKDFKQIESNHLGDFPDLLEVPEGGEIKAGTIGDSKEVYALVSYARMLRVTRRVLINDDMEALLDLPFKAGFSAQSLQNSVAWNAILSNPTMGDGVALFHADHNNLESGAALSKTTVSSGKAVMRAQTNTQGRPMNLKPKYLAVGENIEDTALEILAPQNTSGGFNVHGGKYELIVEPLLGATEFYQIADPNQIVGLEYRYLEGARGLQIDSQPTFNIQGMELKAELDFAAKAVEYRAFVKNPGA